MLRTRIDDVNETDWAVIVFGALYGTNVISLSQCYINATSLERRRRTNSNIVVEL
jgi:hypothetical protein